MSILCALFGHKPRQHDYSGGEYMRVNVGATDGIGRVHATLYAKCARCEEEYRAGQIHVPKIKWEPAFTAELQARRYVAWRDALVSEDPKFIDLMQDGLPLEVGAIRTPTAEEWDAAIDHAIAKKEKS